MPPAGHADTSQRGVVPSTNHRSGGEGCIDPGNAFASVSRREPQASTDDVTAERTDVARGHSAENSESAKPSGPPFGGLLAPIGQSLSGLWKHLQKRREVSRSIVEVSEMDDRMLRDIGIQHRLQIPERVRFGRND